MKSLHLLAAAGLTMFGAFSGLAIAQLPPGITPEMINMEVPQEGAPRGEAGPYAVTNELAFGNEGLRVFRPTSLDSFPRKDKLPVVIWGNGGCAINVGRHAGFVETVASHGFLVISTNGPTPPQPAAPPPAAAAPANGAAAQPGAAPPRPRTATAADQKSGIDWAEAENAREGSPLKGKIDLGHVAVAGQSCGGRLAVELGGDPRVKTVLVLSSGVTGEQLALLDKLHGPALILNGHERDFMFKTSKDTYDAISKVPAFYGARHGGGHSTTIYHPGGGQFANIATDWLMWQFKGDKTARKTFVGKKCGLCTDSNWDVESKRLK